MTRWIPGKCVPGGKNEIEIAGLRPIPGFPDYYASPKGEIYSLMSGRYLKDAESGQGYRGVNTYHTRNYVHRLIALAFHGLPPTPEHEVAHENGIRADNRAENLSWKTRSDNHMDKHTHGTMARPSATISPEDARKIRALYVPRKGVGMLARQFGISPREVTRIGTGKRWAHV